MNILFIFFIFTSKIKQVFYTALTESLFIHQNIHLQNDILNILFENDIVESNGELKLIWQLDNYIHQLIRIFEYNFITRFFFEPFEYMVVTDILHHLANILEKNFPINRYYKKLICLKNLFSEIKKMRNGIFIREKNIYNNIYFLNENYEIFIKKFNLYVEHIHSHVCNIDSNIKHLILFDIVDNVKIKTSNIFDLIYKFYLIEFHINNYPFYFSDKNFNIYGLKIILTILLDNIKKKDDIIYINYRDRLINQINSINEMKNRRNKRNIIQKIFYEIIIFIEKNLIIVLKIKNSDNVVELLTKLIFLLNNDISIENYKKLFNKILSHIKIEYALEYFILYDEINFTYKIVFIENSRPLKYKEVENFEFLKSYTDINTKYDLHYEIFNNQYFFNEPMSSKAIIAFLFKLLLSDITSFNFIDFDQYSEKFTEILEKRRIFN